MVTDNSSLRILISDPEVQSELIERLESIRIEHEVQRMQQSPLWRRRGTPAYGELLVALGSAGVFTTVWRIVTEIVKRHRSREVIISLGEVSITVKGHTHQEEEKLLQQFYKQTISSLSPTPEKNN